MNSYNKIFYIALPLITVLLLAGCSLSPKPTEQTRFVLGTTVTLTLYDSLPTKKAESILDEAFTELYQIENRLSVNKQGTLIDTINNAAGIKPIKVDKETYDLIHTALDYSKLSKGSFDITIGPLVKLWNIGFSNAQIPSELEIHQTLPLIDYHKVKLNRLQHTVYLTERFMQLDLGSIAKGYATDKIIALFKKHHIQKAIVNLGGNLFVLGEKSPNKNWTIGIQNPFEPRGDTLGTLSLTNKSIVTSGIYERFIEDNTGKKYHHLLNPKTGYPFDNDLVGVTIISDHSIDGDALSTTVFALGLKDGLKLINSLDTTEAIFVTKDSKIYLSSGIKKAFTLTDTTTFSMGEVHKVD